MKAKIRNGCLVISLPLEPPRSSASGKTVLIGSSHGTKQSTARLDGKAVCVNVNAFVYPDGPSKGKRDAKERRKR